MRPLFVRGLGLCAPGFRDLAAFRAGAADPAAALPAAALLPANLRRRASALSRFVAEAIASARGGADLSRIPVVTGSVHGEIETAVELIASFREGEGMPSPTRFHNSVHHTAAAYLAMAAGNQGFTTAVAAGPETGAATLLEAWLLLEDRGGEAMVALFDEPPPAPLAPAVAYPPAAVAFRLAVDAAGDGERAGPAIRLARLRRDGTPASPVSPPLAGSPLAPALALALAVDRGVAGTVGLGGGWAVDVEEVAR